MKINKLPPPPTLEIVEIVPEKGFAASVDETGNNDSLDEGYDI